MRNSKRKLIVTLKSLLNRPKWWNEAFAKYDQKKLHAWSKEQQRQALAPLKPKLEIQESKLSDRLIYGEFYRPYVARSNDLGFMFTI